MVVAYKLSLKNLERELQKAPKKVREGNNEKFYKKY